VLKVQDGDPLIIIVKKGVDTKDLFHALHCQ